MHRSSVVVVAAIALTLLLFFTATLATCSPSSSSPLFGGGHDRVRIDYITPPSSSSSSENNNDFYADPERIVPMSLANGSRYHCRLPDRAAASSQEDDDRMWRQHLRRVQDHPLPQHQLARINAALKEQCFTQPAGWWTYKLCWGQSLRQFHLDAAGRPETEYVLGKGPQQGVEDGAVDELLFDVDAFDPTRARLVAEWFNGTTCDLNGEQRMMQLLMYCPDAGSANTKAGPTAAAKAAHGSSAGKHGGSELTVVEPLSCTYQVTIRHPVFCGIEELRVRTKPEVVVQCVELPPAAESDDVETDGGAAAGVNEFSEDGNEPPVLREKTDDAAADVHMQP